MKRFYSIFLLLLVGLLANSFSATTVKKSGTKKWENHISYIGWDFDSLKVGASDSVILLLDSATTTPFSLTQIGYPRQPLATNYGRIPDSIGFAAQVFGEADACSFQLKYEYSLDGTNYLYQSTQDTLTTTAGPVKEILFGTARRYVPGAKARLTIKGTTSTDTVRYQHILVYPIFR